MNLFFFLDIFSSLQFFRDFPEILGFFNPKDSGSDSQKVVRSRPFWTEQNRRNERECVVRGSSCLVEAPIFFWNQSGPHRKRIFISPWTQKKEKSQILEFELV